VRKEVKRPGPVGPGLFCVGARPAAGPPESPVAFQWFARWTGVEGLCPTWVVTDGVRVELPYLQGHAGEEQHEQEPPDPSRTAGMDDLLLPDSRTVAGGREEETMKTRNRRRGSTRDIDRRLDLAKAEMLREALARSIMR